MVRSILSLGLVLAFASAANANTVVRLVPNIPQPMDGYDMGQSLSVSVFLDNQTASARFLRGVQLDFADTNPAIDLVDNFEFDFSTVPFLDAFYAVFSAVPKPAAVYSTPSFNMNGMFRLPASPDALRLGEIDLTLPMAPGDYTLDVLNRDDTNQNNGAFITFGFGLTPADPVTLWRADGTTPAGALTGGNLVLTVVPEPASLSLLALGGLAAAWRRRRRSA